MNIYVDGPAKVNPATQVALSRLVTVTASTLNNMPPFLHLHRVFNSSNERLSVPLPVMAVINGGQYGIGKLKVRSFCVSPSHSIEIADGAKHVINLYKGIGLQLSAKYGVSFCFTILISFLCPIELR